MSDVTMLYAVSLLMSLWCAVQGYSAGAPLAQCITMTPNHGNNQPQAIDDNVPYMVTTSKATYYPGERITVTVQGTMASTTFKGMLLRAMAGMNTPVGTFTLMTGESQLQTLACGGVADSGVTHNSAAEKTSKMVYWTAPDSDQGNVTFRVTVVQQFTTFYVGIVSSPVQYMPMSATTSDNMMNNMTHMMNNMTHMMSTMPTGDDGSGAGSMAGSALTLMAALTMTLALL